MTEESYAERFKGEEHYEVVESIKELYITLRKRFVLQYKTKTDDESGYRVPKKTVKDDSGSSLGLIPIKLSDGWIYSHLKGRETVGLYTMNYFSKFICFDVDTEERSRETTLNLVSTLEDMNIDRKDIHVSLSGNKGYHVEIFFDNTIATEYLKKFYYEVLNKTGYSESEIEYRPTYTEGLKIPLGIHRKTGKRCWYVDNQTLNPIKDYKYVLEIERISAEEFTSEFLNDEALVLSEQDARDFEVAADSLSLTNAMVLKLKEEIREILGDNLLLKKDTRNKYTLFISMYLKDEGKSANDIESVVNNIMLNTQRVKPQLITPSKRKIMRETRKVVRFVFSKNYTLKRRGETIRIFEDEIREVVGIRKWEQKVLYLSMILFMKQMSYSNEEFFPMSYSIMTAMGNTSSRGRLSKAISKLEELGKIEVLRGKRDVWRTEYEGKILSQVNQFKIKKVFNQEGKSILIKDGKDEFSFENIVSELFEEEELRVLLPNNQFYKIKSIMNQV